MVKKSKRKDKKNKFTKQEITLLATFIGLIVLVAVLGIYALNMKNFSNKKNDANLTVPILEEHSQSEIGIEISDMKQGDIKEYILVVSNFKEKNILKNNLTYDIEIISTENSLIKVFKNNSSKNLLEKNSSLIEKNKLKSSEKMEDSFKIIIEAKSKPKAEEKVTIKINS